MAVVTGGTKGIGRAIVDRLGSEGFHVITCARNSDDLGQLSHSFESENKSITTVAADLATKAGCESFAEKVLKLGSPDVLVNNAGSFVPGSILEEQEGAFEQMINVNLASAYHVTRLVVPSMVAKGEGHIFNICSTASFIPYINGGSYCIAKYGLLGMTRVLREELKSQKLRVTAVMPGATFTASWEGADIPPERMMAPHDIAEAIWSTYNLSDRTVIEELILRPQTGDL